MRSWSGFLLVVRLLAFGLAWGVGPLRGGARAASAATEADAAIKHGVELRRRGDDLQALDEFQRAHSLQRSAHALAQIGFAEQALGRWREAEEHLGLSLADTSDAWIRRHREVIEHSRAVVAGHLGSLEVLGGPEGAELRIDGWPVGRLPLARPVRVAAGRIGIELVAEGHLTATRPVTITAGQLARETITLQKIEPPPVVESRSIATAPRPVAREPSAPAVALALPGIVASQRAREDPGGGWQRTAAWIGGGASVFFAGAAVVGLVARGHYADRVDGALRDGRCVQHGDQFTGDSARDCAVAATDRDQAATLALVSGGVAGVLALASTILFVAAPRDDAQAGSVAARARFACAPVGGGVVLQCGGRF